MTNRVQQLYLHVEVHGTEADGLALQHRLSALCQTWLLPAVEQALTRLGPTANHLYLDHLELALGTLTLGNLETELAEAVALALERALRSQPQPGQTATLPAAGNWQLKTELQATREAFLYFLRTGRLPWPFRLPAGRTLEQAVLAAWPAAQFAQFTAPSDAETGLRHLLATAAPVRQRLLKQFSAGFRGQLLATLWPAGKNLLDAVLAPLQQAGHAPVDAPLLAASAAFERQLWEVLLARLATTSVAAPEEIIGEAWRHLTAAAPARAALASLLARHWPGSVPPATARPAAAAARPTSAVPAAEPAAPAARPPALAAESSPPAVSEASLADAEEGYYLDNAGLVLLHPFLPRFFEALGLVEQDQLRQPERALCLLHYLATGQFTAPEHELTLPKVLCGVPLAEPVTADVALTLAETDEADALLAAVVGHWTALRNTSPDGLRGTFLVRPGKLTRRPAGDWLLQVEAQSYDILLAQLPWSISLIQLPWMPQLLRTEWD